VPQSNFRSPTTNLFLDLTHLGIAKRSDGAKARAQQTIPGNGELPAEARVTDSKPALVRFARLPGTPAIGWLPNERGDVDDVSEFLETHSRHREFREFATTRLTLSISFFTISRPIPLDAPVTIATLGSSGERVPHPAARRSGS
jgi:hypothetical protein